MRSFSGPIEGLVRCLIIYQFLHVSFSVSNRIDPSRRAQLRLSEDPIVESGERSFEALVGNGHLSTEKEGVGNFVRYASMRANV